MAPPIVDLPNDRPFFERLQIAIGMMDFRDSSAISTNFIDAASDPAAGFLFQLAVNTLTLPRRLWPVANRFVTRVETGQTGKCRVCIYTPDVMARGASKPRGVVVHIHGGGWTIGYPELETALCRYLCDQLGVVVVAPDYRKAPQYPYPQALEQCYSVLWWISSGGLSGVLAAHNQLNDIDVTRIALSGASAGSNLAASLTLLTFERPLNQGSRIVGLGLLYPSLNLNVPQTEKRARVDPNRVLPVWMTRLFMRGYLPPPRSTSDPYVSPALAPPADLARFPSTVILAAAHDYLAHEAEEFAQHLLSLGVRIEHKRFAQVEHGFDLVRARDKEQRMLNDAARDEAWEMIARVFRGVLGDEEELIKIQVLKN